MHSDGVSERSRDVDELDISLTAAVVGACLYTTEFQNSTIVPHTYASIPLSYFFGLRGGPGPWHHSQAEGAWRDITIERPAVISWPA